MDIKFILTSAVFTSFTTIMLTFFKEWYMSKRNRKKETELSAINLAYKLESFAISCSVNLSELREFTSSYSEYNRIGKYHTKLPNLDISLREMNWHDVDKKYISLILNLTHEIRLSQISINGGHQIDSDAGNKEYVRSAIILGYKSWVIANKLKQKYEIPKLKMGGAFYNPISEDLIPVYQKMEMDLEEGDMGLDEK